MLSREVHDPGVGFVTLTRVQVSPDLQQARVFYTALGDDKSRANTARALERVSPFMRRQIGARLRLKRAPELRFVYELLKWEEALQMAGTGQLKREMDWGQIGREIARLNSPYK